MGVDYKEQILELIRVSSTDISPDVEQAIQAAWEQEDADSSAKNVLGVILENIKQARSQSVPICQDTGYLTFFVHHPWGFAGNELDEAIREAVQAATEKNYLRPNGVDPVTGFNPGTNVLFQHPQIYWMAEDRKDIQIQLVQKGGGSENVSAQYKLPDSELHAGRDLKGVQKCILDAVFQAQGFGCAPGTIGIGIGGDRAASYALAKKQLFRRLDDVNPDPELRELEASLHDKLNQLGVGPMGFGGKTTVLGVKAGKYSRHPASYFVSMAYCCWASRRRTLTIDGDSATIE